MASPWRGVITEYRERLPVPDHVEPISLGEGGTPLVEAPAIGERVGANVYLKVEGANPTGSFKDRGMTVAMTKVAHDKAKLVMCASTGNTSASAAAYAVRAGIPCAVVLPAGKIAAGKLAQAVVHGATLLGVDGSFDDCLTVVQQLDQQFDIAMVNSINPYRLQGQKTAAFEVVDQLGRVPDIQVLPVGNAGNITAYWMGYNEYAGRTVTTTMDDSATTLPAVTDTVPQMWGFQADGAAPLVKGAAVEFPETIATAIRIGNPAAWKWAEAARDNSGGRIEAVTDPEILDAQRIIAAEAGVFVEPASAASVAGVLAAAKRGDIKAGSTIVCTVTGNGLKDTDTALGAATGDMAGAKGETPRTFEPQMIEPTAEAAAKVLGLV